MGTWRSCVTWRWPLLGHRIVRQSLSSACGDVCTPHGILDGLFLLNALKGTFDFLGLVTLVLHARGVEMSVGDPFARFGIKGCLLEARASADLANDAGNCPLHWAPGMHQWEAHQV